MSVTIGFQIGQTCNVLITEEHNGEKQTTAIDPKEFLEKTGLGHYFFELKPDMARMLRNQKRRKSRRSEKS